MSDDIAVVLDTSALRAYLAGRVAVGELIAEVAEEQRRVGVPATCLAAAYAAADEVGVALLMLLVSAPSVRVLPLGGGEDVTVVAEEVRQVGALARLAGGEMAVGHAARVAIVHGAHFVSAVPERVVGVLPAGWSVLDVGSD